MPAINHSRKEATPPPVEQILYIHSKIRCKRRHCVTPAIKSQIQGRFPSAVCLNLPLTRLSGRSECAVRYYVSPDGTAQRGRRGQAYAVPAAVLSDYGILMPQHSQKRFCRKIFCEEERRAFQAYCSVKPNSRKRRSAATSLWTRKFVNSLTSVSPRRKRRRSPRPRRARAYRRANRCARARPRGV